MIITCDFCHKVLTEPGGLLFSPPDKDGMVRKKHICKGCFDKGRVDSSVLPTEEEIYNFLDKIVERGLNHKEQAQEIHTLIIQKRGSS